MKLPIYSIKEIQKDLLFLYIIRPRVPNLWYAEAFQVVREMFSKNSKKYLFFYRNFHTEKRGISVNLAQVHFLLFLNCNTCKYMHMCIMEHNILLTE